eukprot:g11206.t1
MVTPEVPPFAFYYPNQCAAREVKVCTPLGPFPVIHVSNDAGTVCHENRHFIDYKFYLDTFGDGVAASHINPLVPPQPPCSELQGTKRRNGNAERVVGMLRDPVVVYAHGGSRGDQKFKYKMTLKKVLVVDRLPVPLHISAKAVLSEIDSGKDENQGTNSEMFNCFANETKRFEAKWFSSEYKKHPYWGGSGIIQIGSGPKTDDWRAGLQAAMNTQEKQKDMSAYLLKALNSQGFDPSGENNRKGRRLLYLNISKDHFVYINKRTLIGQKDLETKYQRAGNVAWFFASGKKFSKQMDDPGAKWVYSGLDDTKAAKVSLDPEKVRVIVNDETDTLEFLDVN